MNCDGSLKKLLLAPKPGEVVWVVRKFEYVHSWKQTKNFENFLYLRTAKHSGLWGSAERALIQANYMGLVLIRKRIKWMIHFRGKSAGAKFAEQILNRKMIFCSDENRRMLSSKTCVSLERTV